MLQEGTGKRGKIFSPSPLTLPGSGALNPGPALASLRFTPKRCSTRALGPPACVQAPFGLLGAPPLHHRPPATATAPSLWHPGLLFTPALSVVQALFISPIARLAIRVPLFVQVHFHFSRETVACLSSVFRSSLLLIPPDDPQRNQLRNSRFPFPFTLPYLHPTRFSYLTCPLPRYLLLVVPAWPWPPGRPPSPPAQTKLLLESFISVPTMIP